MCVGITYAKHRLTSVGINVAMNVANGRLSVCCLALVAVDYNNGVHINRFTSCRLMILVLLWRVYESHLKS